jgi:molecular chaperone GrpE
MDQGNKKHEDQGKSDDQVKTLEEALEAEKRRSEEYLTQLKYARADLDNLKRRFDRQLEDAEKHSNERIIMELLDVVDELEMAVKSARLLNSAEDLLQGVEMTLKKLTKTLENEGVFPIKSVGERFDPSRHNAVEKIEKEGVEGCTIVEEVRKGYTIRDKVIRASMVKVVVPQSQKGCEIK